MSKNNRPTRTELNERIDSLEYQLASTKHIMRAFGRTLASVYDEQTNPDLPALPEALVDTASKAITEAMEMAPRFRELCRTLTTIEGAGTMIGNSVPTEGLDVSEVDAIHNRIQDELGATVLWHALMWMAGQIAEATGSIPTQETSDTPFSALVAEERKWRDN